MPSQDEPRRYFKQKGKHWLQDTMANTTERLTNAQARYQKSYDARLQKQSEVIRIDDYMYLRVDGTVSKPAMIHGSQQDIYHEVRSFVITD